MSPSTTLRVVVLACTIAVTACESPTEPKSSTSSAPASTATAHERVTPTADGDGCSYAFGPQTSPSADGGSFTVDLTASCPWTAASDQPWLTTSSRTSSWSSRERVAYAVAPNPASTARTGRITVSGGGGSAQLVVTQPGAIGCVSVTPTAIDMAGGGGAGQSSVTVAAPPCAWTAQSNQPWITITSGFSGTTNGSIAYSVAPNPGGQRFGRIIVSAPGGNVDISFTQAAQPPPPVVPCVFTIAPQAVSFPAIGGTGRSSVTYKGPNCLWDAQAKQPWIKITADSATDGFIAYAVDPNGSGDRKGNIVISFAGGTDEITFFQSGQSAFASFTVSPNPCTLGFNPDTSSRNTRILQCTFDASKSSSATGISIYHYSLSPGGPAVFSTLGPTVTNPAVAPSFPTGSVNIYLNLVPTTGDPVTSDPQNLTVVDPFSGC